MALDAKVMQITPNRVKKVQKTKKLKDENREYILNSSRNLKLKTYIEEQKIKKSSYDYWIQLSTLEKGKKIYLPSLSTLKTIDYSKYKIDVEVNPAYTSQECSSCGYLKLYLSQLLHRKARVIKLTNIISIGNN